MDRMCRITASRFGDVIANPKTKRYQNYLKQIVYDIIGAPRFEDEDKPWFRHGKLWETQARCEYEFKTGNKVELDYFIVHPDLSFVGCSPDGKILPNDNLEIKCRKSKKEYEKNIDRLAPNHKPQVQGEMWISGRPRTAFVNFFVDIEKPPPDNTEINIFMVDADKEYHKFLEEKCILFWGEVQKRLHA